MVRLPLMMLHAQEHVNHIDFSVVVHYSVLQANEHKFGTVASDTVQKQTVSTVMISPIRDTSKGLNDISGEPAVHAAL